MNTPKQHSIGGRPSIAALTFTYNEKINLPLWIKHYGATCEERNLYVIDRGSDDGSISDVGEANLIKIPRHEFDEHEKTNSINSFHSALLNFYDYVIYSDCDEFIVPDPDKYTSLRAYIESMKVDCVRALGINVIHILDFELPINLDYPILAQRGFGRFGSPGSKAMISRVPLRWLPGFHSCDRDVEIDDSLVMFHLKFMDYNIACARQLINIGTVWSQKSLDERLGGHHRWDLTQFVHNGFLIPSDVRRSGGFQNFEFVDQIAEIALRTEQANGFWYIPMDVYKWVMIPAKYRDSL